MTEIFDGTGAAGGIVGADVGGSGYTLTELAEYLDRRRTPRDPVIESNPECLAALDRLAALHDLAGDLLADDAGAHADTGWVDGMLASIAREARVGRDIPLLPLAADRPEPADSLVVTEGAVKALVRAAGDGVPGVLVGRCRIVGDATVAGTPLDIRVDISVQPTAPLLALAGEVRAAIGEGIALSAGLVAGRVDVRVVDVHLLAGGGEDPGDVAPWPDGGSMPETLLTPAAPEPTPDPSRPEADR